MSIKDNEDLVTLMEGAEETMRSLAQAIAESPEFFITVGAVLEPQFEVFTAYLTAKKGPKITLNDVPSMLACVGLCAVILEADLIRKGDDETTQA